MKKLKILLCAYACRANAGSEPGVGWNMARELAKHHEVWVLTRESNRPFIEPFLSQHPIDQLHIVYCDLPGWLRWWKHWEVHVHYSLWQLSAYSVAHKLHEEVGFDITQHVTYGRYCAPSFLAFLPIPFIWGPVGGGESAPYSFWQEYGWRGRIYEIFRDLTRAIGELDPLVKLTAQRSKAAIVSTGETEDRVKALGATRIEKLPGQTGINQQELEQLSALTASSDQTVRFLSLGRLLHWKGFHLGIRAFAHAKLDTAEYWILGEGPERQRLEALAHQLGVGDRVRFFGNLPRDKALAALGECNVLVHPSLHDFSPTVCLEAMAAGRPVLCLALGGPAMQITDETGIRVPAQTPDQTVRDLATAMTRLATDAELRSRLGQGGQQRVKENFSWEQKAQSLMQVYERVINSSSDHNFNPVTSPSEVH